MYATCAIYIYPRKPEESVLELEIEAVVSFLTRVLGTELRSSGKAASALPSLQP